MPRLILLVCLLLAASPLAAVTAERVVVLGFTGADAHLTERWMGEGHLPHLVRLAERGGYARVEPVVPVDPAVGWAAAVTGHLPAANGVFDRFSRDPLSLEVRALPVSAQRRSYLWGSQTPVVLAGTAAVLAGLALALPLRRLGLRRAWAPALIAAAAAGAGGFWVGAAWVPSTTVVYDGALAAPPFWELAAAEGIAATVVRAPLAFPARPAAGVRVLTGPGTPDARGGDGSATVWSSDPGAEPSPRLALVRLPQGAGVMRTVLPAPAGGLLESAAAAPLVLEPRDGSLALTIGGVRLTLAPGEWSGWLPVPLQAGPLARVRGHVRFCLVRLTPHLVLMASPISLDPRTAPPWIPLASPRAWAAELHDDLGPFATAGRALDPTPVVEGHAPVGVLLEQAVHLVTEQRLLLRRTLHGSARLVVQHFDLPGELGGVLMGTLGGAGGAADGADERGVRAAALLDTYRLMDEVVGEALDTLGPRDVLLVVSPAGAEPSGAAFDLNAWLVEEGLLTPAGDAPLAFDWARTRVYGLGRGSLYVNLQGRERGGVVAPGAAERKLRWDVTRRLESHPAVQRVWSREDLGWVAPSQLLPDMVVALAPGFVLHEATVAGRIAREALAEPTAVGIPTTVGMSAPHPAEVPGVLFATRPVLRHQVRPSDLAATVLGLLGVTPPANGAGVAVVAAP